MSSVSLYSEEYVQNELVVGCVVCAMSLHVHVPCHARCHVAFVRMAETAGVSPVRELWHTQW